MRIPFLFLLISLFACNNGKQDQVIQLATPAKTKSLAPYLFTDKNDQVFMSWIQQEEGLSKLMLSQLINNAWSDASTISSGTNWFVNWADYPIGASDGNGNLIQSLLVKSGAGTYAYDVNIFTSNTRSNWSNAKLLHHDSTQTEHGFVSIIPYQDGFFAAWLDGRNTAGHSHENHDHHSAAAMTLRAALLNTSADKIQEWELDNRVCDCCQTTAALTKNGPVVIYRDRSDEEIRDIYITRLVDNSWTTPQSIFDDNWEVFGCPVNGPRADANGNTLAVAWFSASNENTQVKVIFSKDGGTTFSLPILVSDNNVIGRVDLVMLDEQSAIVSWMEGAEIKVMKVYIDGRTTKPRVISTSSAKRGSGFPQMVKSGNEILIAWTDDDMQIVKSAKFTL